MLDDPAMLLNGGSEVTDATGITLTPTPDMAQANARAVARLLASRGGCIDQTQAIALTGAGLRVIAGAAAQSE
jgi:hypothetical protein